MPAISAARLASAGAAIEEPFGARRHAHARQEMGDLQKILHHLQRIGAAIVELAQIAERLGDLAAHQLFEQVEHPAAIGQAQHAAHAFGRDRIALVMGDGLIEQR